MKALDLGCGYELERQLPGADLCNCNLGSDEVELEPGQLFFPQFASSVEPLPVADGTYDFIWYCYGMYSCGWEDRRPIAEEITRVAKPRATLIFRDYTQWYNPENEFVNVPFKEWIENIREIFRGWNIDGVYVQYNEQDGQPEDFEEGALGITIVLTKGWG